ncbi:MAG: hypothetical protein PHV74_03535 [Dehalococcoidia bacterium]|nr:hypothetical protein [Dehalococcoidia bacterium]
MASNKISFRQSAEEALRALPESERGRIFTRIEALKTEPVSDHAVKLAGARQLYRLGVGNWRVVYAFDQEARQVLIHHLRRRRGTARTLTAAGKRKAP